MAEVDYHLRSEVSQLQRMVAALAGDVETVGHGVAVVGQQTHETKSEVQSLRNRVEAFIDENRKTANVQRAEIRRTSCLQELEKNFKEHDSVRSHAVSVLQGLDTGVVDKDLMSRAVQAGFLRTPSYWLSPALIGLAAWIQHDRDRAEKAVAEAFRRDAAKTSLAYALILRRQGRMSASIAWLSHYLETQDPRELGRDFAVLLESASQGAFGPKAESVVRERMSIWREQLLTDPGMVDEQVRRWRLEIDGLTPRFAFEYPALKTLSPEAPVLERVLHRASTHARISQKYEAILNAETPKHISVEDAIDDILDRLVSDYDEEELPLRRDLIMAEAIIECDGDLDRAKAQGQLAQDALQETLDYLTIQSSSALRPVSIGVSLATQRVAIGACSAWFARAHQEFSRDYRKDVPADVTAHIQLDAPVASKTFTLPAWSGSISGDMNQAESSLVAHWDANTKPFLDSLVYNPTRDVAFAVVTCVLTLVILGVLNIFVGVFGALVAGGIWWFVIHNRNARAQQNIVTGQKVLAELKAVSIRDLRMAGAQLVDWTTAYKAADQEAKVAEATITKFVGTEDGTPHRVMGWMG